MYSIQEINACAPPNPEFDKFVCGEEEDDDMEEGDHAEVEVDGEMGKAVINLIQFKPYFPIQDLCVGEFSFAVLD
jgi:hypothetical protein